MRPRSPGEVLSRNRCVDARLMNEQSIRHEMDQLAHELRESRRQTPEDYFRREQLWVARERLRHDLLEATYGADAKARSANATPSLLALPLHPIVFGASPPEH
jgi:hypothetical protein